MSSSPSNISVSFVPKAQWDQYGIKPQKSTWSSWLVTIPKCLEKIYNTALMILDINLQRPKLSDVNLLRPFSRYINREAHIVTVPTVAERFHLTSDPVVMRAILDNYHNDPKGLFMGGRVMEAIVGFFQELYPEEKITREDFLLSCNPGNLREYMSIINSFLNPGTVVKSTESIFSVVRKEIAKWEQLSHDDSKGVNVTEGTKIFATTVIFKLIFGIVPPDEDIRAVIGALDSLNQYIIGQYAVGKDCANMILFNASDKNKMFSVLRNTVERVLKASHELENENLINRMFGKGSFSLAQIKIMFITMLMAGQETTAAVLSYAIWQLAQAKNRGCIDAIRKEIKESGYDINLSKQKIKLNTVENVIIEALRLHPAAYVISRDAGSDLACIITDKKTQNVIKTHFISKGEGVNPCPYFAARNPAMFPEPEVFKPERHSGVFTKLSWLPFSAGVEACPGQWLAKNEMRLFLAHLVSNYDLSTEQTEIGAKGLLTLKLNEDMWISLKKRNAE